MYLVIYHYTECREITLWFFAFESSIFHYFIELNLKYSLQYQAVKTPSKTGSLNITKVTNKKLNELFYHQGPAQQVCIHSDVI